MKHDKQVSKTLGQFGKDWPSTEAKHFMAWFQKKLDDIPEGYRDSATIELESDFNNDRDVRQVVAITISYMRPETDEEAAEFERYEAIQLERQRVKELKTLAMLQQKYGVSA
jgi:hypothetical protein